jgi:hypothetical protein
MSTVLTESEQNRVYSFYAASLKSAGRNRNRKTALDSVVKRFGISYKVAREIIETNTAKNLGVDPEQYRKEQVAKRQGKVSEWQRKRDAHIAAGRMSQDSTENPFAVTNRMAMTAAHLARVEAILSSAS